jgi:hypothetical protein
MMSSLHLMKVDKIENEEQRKYFKDKLRSLTTNYS